MIRNPFEFSLKSGWTRISLKNLLTIPLSNGIFKKQDFYGQGVRLINVYDLYQDTEINILSLERIEATDKELEQFQVEEGDLFFCRSSFKHEGVAWTSYINEVTEPTVFECHLVRARPNASQVIPAYLSNYCRTSLARDYLMARASVTTMTTIDQTAIESLPVILPPIEIQRSLVTEIESARQSRKQKLAQADELLSSLDGYLLNQLGLNMPEESNRKVFAIRKGQIELSRLDSFFYTPSLIKSEQMVRNFIPKCIPLISLLREPPLNGVDARDYQERGQRYLRVQNIRPFEIIQDDVKYVSSLSSKDVSLKVGDVLLTRKGTFGVASAVSEDAESCLISSEIILLRLLPNAECSADYLTAWLNSSLANTILNRHKTGGIMGHITQDVVSIFPVPIPDHDIQQTIVSEIYQKREQAQRLRQEAETEWESAKVRFERKLLGEEV